MKSIAGLRSAPLRKDPLGKGGHIVITGTGRAGTTFLVQLFTALGFDTGFTNERARSEVDAISKAGLELPLLSDHSPYVLKSPWFCQQLDGALRSGRIKIRTAIMPMRKLYDAAESRRRVYEQAKAMGLDPTLHPGSVCMTDELEDQELRLLEQFYEGLMALVSHQIPTILLEFPRTVTDANYLFHHLRPLLDDHGVIEAEFMAAHASVAKLDLVHEFSRTQQN